MKDTNLGAVRWQLAQSVEEIRRKSRNAPLTDEWQDRVEALLREMDRFNAVYLSFAAIAVARANEGRNSFAPAT